MKGKMFRGKINEEEKKRGRGGKMGSGIYMGNDI
jgi:hypothetical protein